MAELLLDSDPNLFILDKQELVFKIYPKALVERDNDHVKAKSECVVNITNLTNEYLAARVRTTKKDDYQVSPTYCLIPPKGKNTISLLYISKSSKIDATGHKFKFESIVVNKEDQTKDPKQIFEQSKASNQLLKGYAIKLPVHFIKFGEDNDEEIIQPESGTNDDDLYRSVSQSETGKGKIDEKTQNELLENLKVEYYKLKNELSTQTEKYNNLKNRVDTEKKSDGRKKNTMTLPEIKEPQVSSTTAMIVCGAAILLGYYLTK